MGGLEVEHSYSKYGGVLVVERSASKHSGDLIQYIYREFSDFFSIMRFRIFMYRCTFVISQ